MSEFQEMYNMPNVLGAVDGIHISIFKPPNNDPIAPGRLFFNRKGYYSINCQVVTNATCRIVSINPDFPGSTHDSAVWRASALARHMEREFLQHQGELETWLLDDDDSDSEDDSNDEDNDPAANDEGNEAEGNVDGVDYLAMARAKREELINNYFR